MAIIGPKDPKDSGLSKAIDRTIADLKNIAQRDAEARLAVLEMNARVGFHPSHVRSHLVVENGRVELGTTKPGYFKLLRLPSKRLIGIYSPTRKF